MEFYDTLSEAMNALRTQGYTEDFNLLDDCLQCSSTQDRLAHNAFKVDKFFRFEGETDPADEAILYAISSEQPPLKGLLVNGYGIYSDAITNEMMEALKVH